MNTSEYMNTTIFVLCSAVIRLYDALIYVHRI